RDRLADVGVLDAAPRRAGVLAHDHAQVDPGLVHLVDEELERSLEVRGARAASDRERIHPHRVDHLRARAIEVDVEEAPKGRLDAEVDDHRGHSATFASRPSAARGGWPATRWRW